MLKLREYQERGIAAVSLMLRNFRSVIFQLATGGGKTIVLSAIAYRYSKKSGRKVLILVHRSELLDQTIKTIFKWYDIICFPIAKGAPRKMQTGHSIYVGMVDTVANRIKELPDFGMIIMDETHIGNFKKIHEHFPNAMVIGFSATPISASKKDPLNNYFEDIVCGVDIPELIAMNKLDPTTGLVENRTYSIKGAVDRSLLKVGSNGEFDEKSMGNEFSKSYNVNNALEAYRSKGNGKKCIVFNCSVEHSLLVSKYFELHGIPSRHLDANSGSPDGSMDKDTWRKDCLKWLKNTPGACLHNVGILTTGFDEPSVEVVLVNKSTMSLSHWLQICGRGSRPYPGKEFFTILDLGGNAVTHGDWCDSRDWRKIFHNPGKPGGGGVAPVKECPECEAIVPASTKTCKECGYEFDVKAMKYDQVKMELVLFTKNVNVNKITEDAKRFGNKEYFPLFEIGRMILSELKNLEAEDQLSDAYNLFNEKAKEWYNLKGERFTEGKRKFTEKIFIKLAEKAFNKQYGDNFKILGN